MVDRGWSLSAAGDPPRGSGGRRGKVQAPRPGCALRISSSTFPSVKWASRPLVPTSRGGGSELTPGSISSRAARPPARSRNDSDSPVGEVCSHGPTAEVLWARVTRTLLCRLPRAGAVLGAHTPVPLGLQPGGLRRVSEGGVGGPAGPWGPALST